MLFRCGGGGGFSSQQRLTASSSSYGKMERRLYELHFTVGAPPRHLQRPTQRQQVRVFVSTVHSFAGNYKQEKHAPVGHKKTRRQELQLGKRALTVRIGTRNGPPNGVPEFYVNWIHPWIGLDWIGSGKWTHV